jgi:hypothetical protein
MHLSPEELVDLAEGARLEASAPHLRSCDACRRHVADLRSAMTAAAAVEAPEPSPLFWEHFSARVHGAVAAEGTPPAGRVWWKSLPWAAAAGLATAAAVVLAAYVTMSSSRSTLSTLSTLSPASSGRVISPAATATVAAPVAVLDENPAPLEPLGAADDPSLSIVADLTSQLGPAAAADVNWNHVGAVDEAVSSLTAAERVELRRLLAEALAKRGA